MRFVTFQYGNKVGAGLLRKNHVVDLSHAFFRSFKRPFKFRDLKDFLEADGPEHLSDVDWEAVAHDERCTYPLRLTRFKAPILRPPKITCVGLNYRDHAEEQKKEPPKTPMLFSKAANAVIGSDEAIELPVLSKQIDYEVELAVIIGKEARKADRSAAMNHIFGYTIMNDVTARDIQAADKQWYRGKSFATFAPLGPMVVTPDELDGEDLDISLRLNGEVMQKSNTKNLIFNVPCLIEFISACIPLEVGDVIATGTPGGVGVFRDPPVFLKSGDQLEAEIQGIGILRNPIL